jgi:hypothetical protein
MAEGDVRLATQCGTTSGAKRHYRRGEPICAACRGAQRTYNKEWKRRWREKLREEAYSKQMQNGLDNHH